MRTHHHRRPGAVARHRQGSVSIVFATAVVPLVMSVGLAIDYSFYAEAQAQLNLAADSGAIHAVRIASTHFINGDSTDKAGSKGATAGKQWFAAQAGTLPFGSVTSVTVPDVTYDAGSSTFTSTVTYQGTVNTHFGGLFHVSSWPIRGSANAVITTNSYSEIAMLIDNSSSMLIGATASDIEKLQYLTTCPPTPTALTNYRHVMATGTGSPTSQWEFTWYYGGSTGYTTVGKTNPIPGTPTGSCDPLFTGDPNECYFPQGKPPGLPGSPSPVDANGYCPTGTGTPYAGATDSVTGKTANLPSSPCGFACHTTVSETNLAPSTTDYYTLVQAANQQGANIKLRFDIIQQAAAQVVTTLISKEQESNQFSLGVYTFNSAVAQVHPKPGGNFVEADTNLSNGLSDIQAIGTPAVLDNPNTDFATATAYLASHFTAGGDGTSPTKPRKNLFVITDGLNDTSVTGSRIIGQMTNVNNETNCAPLKKLGFNIYVLYTPYYPLPNGFYLRSPAPNNARIPVEAPLTDTTNSIAAALKACASAPGQYYQASDSTEITTALQAMLASALAAPGRISN